MLDHKQNIKIEEYLEIKNSGKKLLLIDVRDVDEYKRGHLEGAVCIPVHQITKETLEAVGVNEPYAHEEIILYCLSGTRSSIACNIMKNIGFCNVKNISGGIRSLDSY